MFSMKLNNLTQATLFIIMKSFRPLYIEKVTLNNEKYIKLTYHSHLWKTQVYEALNTWNRREDFYSISILLREDKVICIVKPTGVHIKLIRYLQAYFSLLNDTLIVKNEETIMDIDEKLKADWKDFPLLDDISYYMVAEEVEAEFDMAGTTRYEVIINKLMTDKQKLAEVVYDLHQQVQALEAKVEFIRQDYD